MAKKTRTLLKLSIALICLILIVNIYNRYAISTTVNDQVSVQDATQPDEPSKYNTTPPTRQELLELLNQERAKVGVAPLTEDSRLNESAQRKADDMAKYDYFEHVSPHDGRHGYTYVFDTTGSVCLSAGENLRLNVTNHNTASEAIAGWISSEPHYEAMIDSKYLLTGFGISGNYIVEHFCQLA